MFSLGALDLLIGLVFVYLLLSTLCTTFNEWIAGLRDYRAKTLETSIQTILGALAESFWRHSLIHNLKNGTTKPSYVPSHLFARAVLELTDGKQDSDIAKAVGRLRGNKPANDPEAIREVAVWFDEMMDHFSGGYRRKMQKVTFATALLFAVAVNADTIQIVQTLWSNPTVRAALVAEAEARVQKGEPLNVEYQDPNSPEPSDPIIVPPARPSPLELTETEKELLAGLIGWSGDRVRAERIRLERKLDDSWGTRFDIWTRDILPEHLLGWVLTGVAVSLGAPFWFDALNKLMNIRMAGRKPERAPVDGKPASAAGV
jgi:hypothetical protein